MPLLNTMNSHHKHLPDTRHDSSTSTALQLTSPLHISADAKGILDLNEGINSHPYCLQVTNKITSKELTRKARIKAILTPTYADCRNKLETAFATNGAMNLNDCF